MRSLLRRCLGSTMAPPWLHVAPCGSSPAVGVTAAGQPDVRCGRCVPTAPTGGGFPGRPLAVRIWCRPSPRSGRLLLATAGSILGAAHLVLQPRRDGGAAVSACHRLSVMHRPARLPERYFRGSYSCRCHGCTHRSLVFESGLVSPDRIYCISYSITMGSFVQQELAFVFYCTFSSTQAKVLVEPLARRCTSQCAMPC